MVMEKQFAVVFHCKEYINLTKFSKEVEILNTLTACTLLEVVNHSVLCLPLNYMYDILILNVF